MAERKFAALAELRQRPDPPPLTAAPATPEPNAAAPPIEPPALEQPPTAAAPPPTPPSPKVPELPPVPAATAVAAVIPPETQKGRGRPPGKRSDPDWAPRTILMRAKTHRRVSIMLLERDGGPDLSELVDELLTEWISRQA
jgi:hypothetical protein